MNHHKTASIAIVAAITLTSCSTATTHPDPAPQEPTSSPAVVAEVEGRPSTQWRENANSPAGRRYVAALAKIHPDYQDPRVLGWAISTCQDIYDQRPVARNTKLRYAGGDRPPLTKTQVRQIIRLTTKYICPDLA